MEAYRDFLSRDAKGRQLLKNDIVIPQKTKSITMSLVWSILGQQLSIQVAKVKYQRFMELFDGKIPKPDEILKVQLKSTWLSSWWKTKSATPSLTR